jgi:uncharacterized membrane protein
MLLEDILLALAVGAVLVFVGLPIVRLLRSIPSLRRRDPLAEARARLDAAKNEEEAAKLHREADRIYERLYDDTLAEDAAAQGSAGREEAEEIEPPMEKDKRHGQD